MPDYYRAANKAVGVVLQLETPHAIAQLEEIAAVPGVDALFVGPAGVSGALGRENAKGLLGRDGLDPGEGVLLSDPLGTIHMFFMRFAIDAVFLSRDLEVVRIAAALKRTASIICPRSNGCPRQPKGCAAAQQTA